MNLARLRKRLFFHLFLGLLIAGFGVEAQDVDRELDSIIEELNLRQNWLGEADRTIKSLQESVRESDQLVARAGKRIAEFEQSILDIENEINGLTERRNFLSERTDALTDSVNWHLQIEYRMHRTHWLKQIVNQENAQLSDRLSRYHQYFIDFKRASLDEFSGLLRELIDVSSNLLDQQALLEPQQDQWVQQQQQYEMERTERKEQIDLLNEEIVLTNNQVEKLLADRQRLEQLLDEIQDVEVLPTPPRTDARPSMDRGTLAWPVNGRIHKNFGDSRADGRLSWEAVHIEAEVGATVFATAPGTVTFADWLRGYGMMVVVEHDNEVRSIYGYCDALLVNVGDRVEAGEAIASVGQSGGQSMTGLYFEVQVDSNPVNPIDWLEKR